MGVHFDDVLVHGVCWSSRCDWGYPSTKDTGIGIAHANIWANGSVDPLIWRPWVSLFPLWGLGQWCCQWWWSGIWLEVAKFLYCGSKWGGKLAAIVKCGKFCLGSWWHDIFEDGRQGENGTIVKVFVIAIGYLEMSYCSTFSTLFKKYDASMCTDIIMLHALYQMPALGCVAM